MAIPFRPHALVPDPAHPGSAIAVARRPGDFVARVDLRDGRIATIAPTDADRVFEGHAAWSRNGAALYTVETDIGSGLGTIGVRDPASLEKRDEWTLPAIGPHAVLVDARGALWIAVGGILTLPETGRVKRNLDTMRPELMRLSPETGELSGRWRLDDPRLGVRHLAALRDGTIGVALQAEHDDPAARERAPVLACLIDGRLVAAAIPDGPALHGYGADIAAVSVDGAERFAVSCPYADTVALWDPRGSGFARVDLAKARALASDSGALYAVGDDGEVSHGAARTASGETRFASGLRWDNHMAVWRA